MIENCNCMVLSLPRTITELSISRNFFRTTAIDDNFLYIAVEERHETQQYKIVCEFVNNLACVNDSAEHGVALIKNFNSVLTKNEEQKQFLLQVVEKHCRDFSKCNHDTLVDMQNYRMQIVELNNKQLKVQADKGMEELKPWLVA